MAPKTYDTSWPEWKHPSYLKAPVPSIQTYMEGLQKDDGAEGLWRIHDNLYDLSEWIDRHPGGAQWLQITKGTDITEAFESHHISPMAESLLSNFFIRKTVTPRNSPFTFRPDGFYRTLKTEVWKKLGSNVTKFHPKTNLCIDTVATCVLTLSVLSAMYSSTFLAILSGFGMASLVAMAHNFFHRRDNWRMFYFQLSFLSVNDWRVSHVLSHHLFPNTTRDLEMTLFFPFFDWFPHRKSWIHVKLSPFYAPLAYPFVWLVQFIQRAAAKSLSPPDILCLVIPTLMYFCSNQGILNVLYMWAIHVLSGSFLFVLIGLNAAHHHPEIFHQGDAPREDRDWGLNQLDAVRARPDERNLFIVLSSFGEHALHHLFPTLDHAYLSECHDVLAKVCKQFGHDCEYKTNFELFKGQLQQLSRTIPNDKLKYL